MLTFGLTIVRHGETQYNKDKLLQGQGIDSPLSEIGIQQAEAAGKYLQNLKFTNVFASNMRRARQMKLLPARFTNRPMTTADIIVKNNLHCSDIEIVTDPLLKERSFGIAEGRPVQDMKNMAKAAGQSCPDFTPPQGETPEQVKTRIREFLKSMFQRMVQDHCRDGPQQSAEGNGPVPASHTDGPIAGRPDDGVHDVPVHALVVGHGAYMRVAVRYIVEELRCSVPPELKMTHVFSACPNTGMCRFVLTLGCGEAGLTPTAVRCVFINRRDHLKSSKDKE